MTRATKRLTDRQQTTFTCKKCNTNKTMLSNACIQRVCTKLVSADARLLLSLYGKVFNSIKTCVRLGHCDNNSELIHVARGVIEGEIKNMVVMVGAGISTLSGLPDFRTPGSGIYESMKRFNLPDPTAVFDIEFFEQDPAPFYTVAKDLHPGKYKPNYVHYFVRMLQERNLLLRMYTQNIDGLERIAGIKEEKLVEAHGTFATATCRRCHQKYVADDIKQDIFSDKVPQCTKCKGVIKPDIVFFGEDLPASFHKYPEDLALADLLIVMGTSLEVYPFASIADATRQDVPRILVNYNVVGPFVDALRRPHDIVLKGDLLQGTKRLAHTLGYDRKVKVLMENELRRWKAEE